MSEDNDDQIPGKKYGRGKAPGSRAAQFDKGRSGNYRGRPPKGSARKAASGSSNDILADGDRLVTRNDTGEVLTVHQLRLQSESSLGARGNAYALRHSIDRYEAVRKEQNEKIRQCFENAWLFKEQIGPARLKSAQARKNPLWQIFPHPDNIILRPDDLGFWVFGGLSPEQNVGIALLYEVHRVFQHFEQEDRAALERRPASEKLQQAVAHFRAVADGAAGYLKHVDPIYVGMTKIDPTFAPSRPDTAALRVYYQALMERPDIRDRLRGDRLLTHPNLWEVGRAT